ncbi:MAG: PsbP-related protein [Nitrososphaeraceae archaeon]
MNKIPSSYMMILGMIFSFCVAYQAKEVFATTNDSSQIKEGFSIYHSPKLGFDIPYPSDWSVEEDQWGIFINFPVSTQDKIDNSTKSVEEALEEAQRAIEDIESGESESILMRVHVRNQTAEDPDNIKTLGVQSIQSRQENFPDVNTIEASESTLAGLPAFKTVYTLFGIKEMEIETLSNNKIYTVSYSAPSYLYDVYLPEVEYAINSTKINN